jgi:hypothetical protein
VEVVEAAKVIGMIIIATGLAAMVIMGAKIDLHIRMDQVHIRGRDHLMEEVEVEMEMEAMGAIKEDELN